MTKVPHCDLTSSDLTTLLRQKLRSYRYLPNSLRKALHEHIQRFFKTVTFETPDRIYLTDEMKTLIAGHACLLLLGDIGDFSKLKSIHVYRREFRRHNDNWTTYQDGPELHVAWDKIAEGMENTSGWNPLLFRLAEALNESIGWRGHEAAFAQWLQRYKATTPRHERLKDVDIVSPEHALQLFVQDFFEAPEGLQEQDADMFDMQCAYFQVNPLEWKASRREAIGDQPVPAHWNDWLGKIRFYDELNPDQRSLLHHRIHVQLDEIEFAGDRLLEMTEEMKVMIAANTSLFLLGSGHVEFAGLSKVTLLSGRPRHVFTWRGGHLKLSWERAQNDLANPANGHNCVLGAFFYFLNNPKPSEGIPAITEEFKAFERRKRSRRLHGWEWDGVDSADSFTAHHFVCFLEQPHEVHRDLPELYEAFRDYFALDPLELAKREAEKRQVPFQAGWRRIMRKKIGMYEKLPRAERGKLEKLMPKFLGQVEFIARGLPEVTEEMRVTIAGEACILIVGRSMEDYRYLRSVEVWMGNPDGKYDAVGDANRERVRLNWKVTEETALDASDNYNIVLHEFAHIIDTADDGDADSIPLPANDAERREWEELIRREQAAIRYGRFRDDKHLIREYGASDKAEFFTCATEAFFEKSIDLQRDHKEIYDILKGFYNLDPAAWR